MKAREIVITRPQKQAEKFATQLRESGLLPLFLPMIKTVPIHPNPAFEAILSSLNDFKWIVFTSVNAVDYWFDMLERGTQGVTSMSPSLRIAAIGSVTARRLRDYGVKKVWLPSRFTGECLATELPLNSGDKILLPRASKAMKSPPRILGERGATVTDLPIYETVETRSSRHDFVQILDRNPAAITFTSPSAVNSFKKHLEKFGLIKPKSYYAAIGPTTGKAIEENGFSLDILPEDYTLDGLIVAINEFFEQKNEYLKS